VYWVNRGTLGEPDSRGETTTTAHGSVMFAAFAPP
jgi:hypothetical protein